jgi:hypothetical protein
MKSNCNASEMYVNEMKIRPCIKWKKNEKIIVNYAQSKPPKVSKRNVDSQGMKVKFEVIM